MVAVAVAVAVAASVSAADAVAAYVTFSHLSHTEQLSVSHTNTCQQQHTHTHTYIYSAHSITNSVVDARETNKKWQSENGNKISYIKGVFYEYASCSACQQLWPSCCCCCCCPCCCCYCCWPMVHVIFWQAGLISEQRPFLVKLTTYNPLSLPPLPTTPSLSLWGMKYAHILYMRLLFRVTQLLPLPLFMMNVCGPLAK